MDAKLEALVTRLEAVAAKLEKCGVAAPAGDAGEEETEDYPAVTAYDETFNPHLKKMMDAAKAIDPELAEMTQLVLNMFAATRKIILVGCRCAKPDNNAQFEVLNKLSQAGIQWCDKHFKTKHVNNLKAVNEAMTLLTWPQIGASAEDYATEMTGSVMCYTNKLSMQYRGVDEKQMNWVTGFVAACKAIPTYINDYQKGGIKFNARGKKATPEMFALGGAAAAPAAAAPAPAAAPAKPAKPEPAKPAAKAAGLAGKLAGIGPKPVAKEPSVKRVGAQNQVQVEYFTSGQVTEFPKLQHEDIVNIFQCKNCEITIPSKVKALSVLGCERIILSPNDVIGVLELNGLKRSKIYCEGVVKTITCDKCDSLEIYLNEASLKVQLISSQSTGINLEYPDPKDKGNYIEHAVPEQIKVQFNDDAKLEHHVYVHE
ncbi:hypothetical protein TVAG_407250 [Trichomonas vaginalis G3]|uniref:C-CAP/cofactor C-like domain-containing protein n=1 Tax=Trichomonas vaginalis (strain ATCC PRA-98 / G3) TaxID=412133 RepID=A2F422_TRIV3|nr:adenylate cyclase binding [Trichomonas vaginalis G3]EAY00376.1 hypothetical protein TVAG_407250 [Trichomonas vaginalis G3]KAI5552361.1 adenylate cyclase binding [Trichomonas vaginalis G3]|eukprot:XP_001313305.1 hypothetical protein [Trichomonas vaginalis G3]